MASEKYTHGVPPRRDRQGAWPDAGNAQRLRFSAAQGGSQSMDLKLERRNQPYPRTLILENDSTARDEIGRPIDIAGRNVVKISILFTCGSSS